MDFDLFFLNLKNAGDMHYIFGDAAEQEAICEDEKWGEVYAHVLAFVYTEIKPQILS